MFGTLLREYSSTTTAPCASSCTPTASSPRPAVTGWRPVANMTASTSSCCGVPAVDERGDQRSVAAALDAAQVALQPHVEPLAHQFVVQVVTHVVVEAAQDLLAAVGDASPRRRDRGRCRRTRRRCSRRRRSARGAATRRAGTPRSEVIANSAPGIAGRTGWPPVATSMCCAVYRRPATSTVCGSTSVARPSYSETPAVLSSVR